VKAHLSALRHWFDKLVMAHVVRDNPAQAVRTERFRRTTGATPWMPREDARKLFKAFDHAITAEADEAARLLALRDRALLAVMLFGFGRVSAVTGMKVRDYQQPSTVHAKLRFHEKRGKVHEVPAHTTAIEALDAWLSASGLAAQPDAVLFPASTGGGAPRFTGAGISRQSANEVVKRWCALAGLPADISNHSFRATGLTLHRQAGGDIRRTQELAGHADISTTMLYDHSGDELQRAEVELVRI
jgi:integrase/recombinase XerD